MKKLTHFSLFTGIGGIDFAAEAAGFSTVCQCEWADFPTAVLKKHWLDVPRFQDITTVTKEAFIEKTGQDSITLISGGFPCQPFSAIGAKKGFTDPRYLWPQMCRVIRELKPRFVLGENVANFINMGLNKTILDLEKAGYAVWTFVLPACSVGAWHERKRTFIVGADVSYAPCFRHGNAPKGVAGSPISCGLLSQKEENGALVGESFGGNLLSGKGCRSQSSLQSGVGGVADGIPASMDGNLLWITEPTDIPRLTEDKKDRVKRLKALGNAVVPAQVYPILKYIADIELGRCKKACVFSGKEGDAI